MRKEIRVVHITTIDEGGAYTAVCRIQDSLRKEGFLSDVLVRTKQQLSSDVVAFQNSVLKSIISKTKNVINRCFAQGEITRDLLGSDISKHELIKEADIIFLHWINSFLSYRTIEKLFKLGKPIIWVMHDTWLFTGGCHVNLTCERYRNGCGNCPFIGKHKEQDISYKNYKEKQRLFEKYSSTITGPSNWIVAEARKSGIVAGKDIVYIPNCYDEAIFYPRTDKNRIREKLQIDTKKKIILFGAAFNGTANRNKGFSYLLDALQELAKEEYFLLIFGNAKEEECRVLGQEYRLLGYISDEKILSEVYNIADVYVTPSLQESFGLTVCEAMACGTPVTAFPVGGINDQITHKANGYLAELKNSSSLSQGIEYCVENRLRLGEEAAKSAKRFTSTEVGKVFGELIRKKIQKQL